MLKGKESTHSMRKRVKVQNFFVESIKEFIFPHFRTFIHGQYIRPLINYCNTFEKGILDLVKRSAIAVWRTFRTTLHTVTVANQTYRFTPAPKSCPCCFQLFTIQLLLGIQVSSTKSYLSAAEFPPVVIVGRTDF